MKYSSHDDNEIYQRRPVFSKPTMHKPKGWTDTVLGYCNEAKKLTMCILRNRRYMKRPCTRAVHINHTEKVSPEVVVETWTTACRKLKRLGIVALWVREPNRLGKVHYHLLVKSHISEKELKKAIEKAMPDRMRVKWRKRVEPIHNEFYYAHYMTKAKVAGYDPKGKRVADRYAHKRLLFKASLGFKKYGTIGGFWEPDKTKSTLWGEIKAEEKRIAAGLDKPNVRRLIQYVYDLLGGDISVKDLERSFGYDADDPVMQAWIESLLAGEWAEADR